MIRERERMIREREKKCGQREKEERRDNDGIRIKQ